jgi:IS5 family transposase
LVQRIHTLSERYPRFGYRKMYHLLKAEHWGVNRETVRRIRKHEGLQVMKKERKRRPVGASTTTPTCATQLNHGKRSRGKLIENQWVNFLGFTHRLY